MTMTSVTVSRSTSGSRWAMRVVLNGLVALAVAPYWAGTEDLQLLAELYGYIMLASLWNLLAGYSGLVSIGQQAFVGLGAYGVLLLASHGTSPFVAIPVATVGCAVIGVPVPLTDLPGLLDACRPLGLADTTVPVHCACPDAGAGADTSAGAKAMLQARKIAPPTVVATLPGRGIPIATSVLLERRSG